MAAGCQHAQGGVPLGGEGVADLAAQPVQGGELGLPVGTEGRRPGGRVAVDLVADRQRGRVAEHDVGVRDARGSQGEAGAEGQVVDDHLVGLTRSTTSSTARAGATGSHSRSVRRASAW